MPGPPVVLLFRRRAAAPPATPTPSGPPAAAAALLLRRRAGPGYASTAAPPFTPDPDVLALMDRVCAVEVDTNVTGLLRSAHGATPRGPWATVPGLDAVPCHPVFPKGDGQDALDVGGQEVPATAVKWLFAQPVALDTHHRIAWADPDRGGKVRYFYGRSPSFAPGGNLADDGRPLYWCFLTYERFRVTTP